MKKVTTFLILILGILNLSAQKTEKVFYKTISYKTGNKNGKDLTVKFAIIYDTYLNDPITKSGAKIISEGNFIVYNGKRYTAEDIGQDVFDRVSMNIVNVRFEIWKSSLHISTVKKSNLRPSAPLISNGYFWKNLWPGVNASDAKSYFRFGFSVRNAELYNVEFNLWPLKDLLAKRKREKAAKERKEEQERLSEIKRQEQIAENEKEKRQAEILEKEEQERKAKKNKQEKKITSGSNESEKLALKKIETARLEARKLKEENLKTALKKKKDQEKIDEDLKNAAVRRRMAERREKERKRKEQESIDKLTKVTGDAVSGIFGALSDGSLSSFRIGIGIREDTKELYDDSFYSPIPSLITYEIGFENFYMGFGFPDSDDIDVSGFSALVGLDYFFFEDYSIVDFVFGFNVEFGWGSEESTRDSSFLSYTSYDEAIFYSVGVQTKLFKYFYISYNYGFFNGKSSTTRYSDNRNDVHEKGDGNFTKLGLSFVFSF